MAVALGHGLELRSMKVYEMTSSGSWKSTSIVIRGKKYRYKLIFKNTNSSAYMPPITEPHAFLELYGISLIKPSNMQFYSSESYSGSSYTSGSYPGSLRLGCGKTGTVYFYFKWTGPGNVPMPVPPVRVYTKVYSAVHKSPCDQVLPLFS